MTRFSIPVFLGAFLLFQIQPILAKAILPWFGGGPAVWTACLLFFQSALLAGYVYAHYLEVTFPRKTKIALHLGLLTLSLAFLPVLPSEAWQPTGDETPLFQIIKLLLATVYLPYMLLAASAPLLQSWFHELHPGKSPYRLFALSNAGSLLGLLSYPFVFEPMIGLSAQAKLWALGFVIYGGCLAWTAMHLWKLPDAPTATATKTKNSAPDEQVTWTRKGMWIALAACASTLLLTVTNQLCQNVAVVPFLWILPLSLYLVSFIIPFDHPRWYKRRLMLPLMALGTLAILWHLMSDSFNYTAIGWQIAAYCFGLFAICLVCHGELARLKPAPKQLTSFYLMIAAGGALGGLFVNLIAPQLFNDFTELKLALVAAVFFAGLSVLTGDKRAHFPTANKAKIGYAAWITGTMTLAVILSRVESEDEGVLIAKHRDFYGVLHVSEVELPENAGKYRALYHGQVIHGIQMQREDWRKHPTTYYTRISGIGLATMLHPNRQLHPAGSRILPGEGLNIGGVGLGIGTIAALAKPGDRLRFYELDPNVAEFATEHFSFLADASVPYELRIGDGRVALENEPPRQYDILALDAFSGDAIPVHLLTSEAFQLYWKHLKPDGILALHITSAFFDLERVVLGAAGDSDRELIWIVNKEIRTQAALEASWILITSNQVFLNHPIIKQAAKEWPTDTKPVVWTDDFSNLLSVMK